MNSEWLNEDYRYYCRDFEQEQDNGNIGPEEHPVSFDDWLAAETPEYRRIHGVPD